MIRILRLFIILIICSCSNKSEDNNRVVKKEKIIKQFGYVLNDYHVVRDTVKRGDSFGTILEKNNLFYPQIYNIVQKVKRVYDIRKINIGKPYTILFSKDSLRKPEVFVYQPNLIEYVLVSLNDSLWAEKNQKQSNWLNLKLKALLQAHCQRLWKKKTISLAV